MENWFPGLMVKTKRQIKEDIKLIDLLLILRDARVPGASNPPFMKDLLPVEKTLTILSRSDLAAPDLTEKWLTTLNSKNMKAFALDIPEGKGLQPLVQDIKKKARAMHKDRQERGKGTRDFRIMVAGIPNVGKSTLLNALSRKRGVKTGNQPGTTRGKQWVHTQHGFSYLDTPGILLPSHDREKGLLLSAAGIIQEGIFDKVEVAWEILSRISIMAPERIEKRLKIKVAGKEPLEILSSLGESRGCYAQGGEINMDSAATILIKEFRAGKIGQFTLETPEEDDCLAQ